MERRRFVKSGLIGATGLGLVGTAYGHFRTTQKPDEPFKLNYAPHQGMFSNHAGNDFVDQIKYMAERGFRGIEDNRMMGRSTSEQKRIGDELERQDMTMGVFVIDKGGNGANTFAAGKQEHTDIFLKSCREAVEVAKRVNAKWMTVVPGNFERRLPNDIQTANVVETLKRAKDIFEPQGLVMVLEALSDTPDLFLRTTPQSYLICKAVDSPSCKILYDAYHMQKNEGNLITNIDWAWDEIVYYQVGDNPGRKEPYTGEINYRNIFKHLYDRKYMGIVGMEHGISEDGKDGEEKLIAAYRKADNFL